MALFFMMIFVKMTHEESTFEEILGMMLQATSY